MRVLVMQLSLLALVACDPPAQPVQPPGAPGGSPDVTVSSPPIAPRSLEPLPGNPPPKLDPPFGEGEGLVLDTYEFGGEAGRGFRLRVVGRTASLWLRGDLVQQAPLTDAEHQALSRQLAQGKAQRGQSGYAPHPDSMASGFFFAGQGEGKVDLTRWIHALEQRLSKLGRGE